MKTVGSYEAKTHLPRLLDEVAEGRTIAITRHGRRVAVLQPVDAERKLPVADTIESIKKLRKRLRLGNLSLRKMIEEGRE